MLSFWRRLACELCGWAKAHDMGFRAPNTLGDDYHYYHHHHHLLCSLALLVGVMTFRTIQHRSKHKASSEEKHTHIRGSRKTTGTVSTLWH